MTPWPMGRMCAFDTETTGVDVANDRIVSAAIVLVGGGEPVQSRTWLIDPGIEIPAGATAVHGITTEHARQYGEPAGQSIIEIGAALKLIMDDGIPIVGWNSVYDCSLFNAEAARHRCGTLDFRPVIDGLVLDKHCHPYRNKGSRKLVDVAKFYGVELGEKAHGAEADAMAAVRVVWKIARQYPQLVEMTADQLHDAQVEWAAEQQESLERHFRKTRPDAVVERGWPIRTAETLART